MGTVKRFMLSGQWQHILEAKDEDEAERIVSGMKLEELNSYGVDDTELVWVGKTKDKQSA